MKKKTSNTKFFILFTILLIIFFISEYLNIKFKTITTEQLMYTLIYNKGTSLDPVLVGIPFILIRLLITGVIILIFYLLYKRFKNKKVFLYLKRNENILKKISLIIITTISLFSILNSLKIPEYIKLQSKKSNIFEKYYVDPKNVEITFPEEKQNLIYIYVESLEVTSASKLNGGGVETSFIPNLENIALNNTNFSNKELLGGATSAYGTAWTASALIAQTAGIPLKLQIDDTSYIKGGSFLPGAYSLGEILEKNGYKNYFLLGSDAIFGRREDYFTEHGNYKILDYKYGKSKKYISEDYFVWWGYEDKKLYDIAKKELLTISKNNEPFNFTILTADTHFPDGYVDKSCSNEFDSNYANSFKCTDKMLSDFIKWIEKQDFYKNTSIIIVGDHLTMEEGFYETLIDNNYTRTVYNVIINSRIDESNTKNRIFSTMDMYPTTLAVLGVRIDGDKLGLGTNLYSNKKTLFENLGVDYVNKELGKNSEYYDNNIVNIKK